MIKSSAKVLRLSLLALGYLILYLPILGIMIYSFNSAERGVAWQGFSLKWYVALFHSPSIFSAAGHSMMLGLSAATIATILGTVIAITIFRYRFRARQVMYNMNNVLMLIPEIIIAVFLLLIYTLFQVPLGFWSLVVAHVAISVPFVVTIILSQTGSLDYAMIEAAMDLGASDFVIWRRILVPFFGPAIMVGWIIAFTLSVDDIIVSYFVSGPAFNILPFKIYSMIRTGIKPEINALSSLMMLFTWCLVLLGYYVFKVKKVRGPY